MPDSVLIGKVNTANADPAAAVEEHPLAPFLPAGARILLLGSFPPPRRRWSVDFFYPNFTNDMWRIFGLVFREDRDAFVDVARKRFDCSRLVPFLEQTGVALYDTATAVRRLQGNASDRFLEVVRPTDVAALLRRLPACHTLATTGQKATETLCAQLGAAEPPVGGRTNVDFEGRNVSFYRLPSSSRAYPLRLERKAEIYENMFREVGIKK